MNVVVDGFGKSGYFYYSVNDWVFWGNGECVFVGDDCSFYVV